MKQVWIGRTGTTAAGVCVLPLGSLGPPKRAMRLYSHIDSINPIHSSRCPSSALWDPPSVGDFKAAKLLRSDPDVTDMLTPRRHFDLPEAPSEIADTALRLEGRGESFQLGDVSFH